MMTTSLVGLRMTTVKCLVPPIVCLCTISLAWSPGRTEDLSPRQVVEKFCTMDSQGRQLSPEGLAEMTPLFLRSTTPNRTTIYVVRDYVISNALVRGHAADIFVEYTVIGKVDSHFRLRPIAPDTRGPMKVRVDYHLVESQRAGEGGLRWRIQSPLHAPHVLADVMIQRLSQLSDTDPDAGNRKAAAATVAALRRDHPPN